MPEIGLPEGLCTCHQHNWLNHISQSNIIHKYIDKKRTKVGALWDSFLWWPLFLRIPIKFWSLFYALNQSDWHPFSAQKLFPSLDLVPEILGPKVGVMFHQNVLFNNFEAFSINFLLWFSIQLTPFHWIMIFLAPYFYKT